MIGLQTRLAVVACIFLASANTRLWAQNQPNERVFPQSKATIEKVLTTMQANLSGRLPVLDGFATSDHLDRYQRGYYQANVELSSAPGGSLVRITTKVTAWYTDPTSAHSGYQLLPSNGRLEADLFDQLTEQLAKSSPEKEKTNEQVATVPPRPAPVASAAGSAGIQHPAAPPTSPANQTAKAQDAAAAPESPNRNALASSINQSLAASERASRQVAVASDADSEDKKLRAEADGLEGILKNQSRPKNLVAVKQSGTPVVDKPSLSAKPLFQASMHDEFEMLDFNEDWVHVRISGLSRGWIWRNSLEMPEGIPDAAAHSTPGSSAGDLFRVTREETAAFPGDWTPLRGKNVRILSVQRVEENPTETELQDKLEYAKYLLEKTYSELAQKQEEVAGVVLIFDSADGGMIAATLTILQQWKAGSLSDAALWHNCFFDPPETFTAAGSSGTQ
jgi:hypothetical protein